MSQVLQRVDRYRVERVVKTDTCLHAVIPEERKLLRRAIAPQGWTLLHKKDIFVLIIIKITKEYSLSKIIVLIH